MNEIRIKGEFFSFTEKSLQSGRNLIEYLTLSIALKEVHTHG